MYYELNNFKWHFRLSQTKISVIEYSYNEHVTRYRKNTSFDHMDFINKINLIQ